MKTKITIKNFRVFDETGVDIQLSPITILTGRNSSGKSSVVKAITLLNSFLQQVAYDMKKGNHIDIANYKIDFTKYPNTLLGGLDKIIHRGSKSSLVVFEYTMHSCMLFKDVKVCLSFGMQENDDIKNGYLVNLELKTLDDNIIYSSNKTDGSHYNMMLIKDSFLNFVRLEDLVHNFCGLVNNYDIFGNVSKEEYKELGTKIIDALHGFDKSMCKDVFQYVRKPYSNKESLIKNVATEIVNWSSQSGSLFYIPLVENLSTSSKEDVKEEILKILKGKTLKEGERYAINRVVDDFVTSSYPTLREFFSSWEEKYLMNVKYYGDQSVILSTLSLPYSCHWQPMEIVSNPIDVVYHKESPSEGKTDKDNRDEAIYNWKNKPLDFMFVYEAMMLLNSYYPQSDNKDFFYNDQFFGYYNHRIYNIFQKYAIKAVEELMLPEWCDTISYVSTSRMEMQRLYVLDSRSDFSAMLNNYLDAKRKYMSNKNARDYEPDSFMNSWISQLGLGNSITVERDKEGYGVYIRLHKNEGDEGVVLADEGYGVTQLASILISIETVILTNGGKQFNQYYGMSMLDKFDDRKFHYAQRTIAVEEPEIHLHPQYQSLLADLFTEAAIKYDIHFIIETHSEYLIRKMQYLIANKSLLRNDLSLNYLYSKEDYISPSEKRVKRIDVLEDGSLSDSFGSGFYDEADNLSMGLLKTQIESHEE